MFLSMIHGTAEQDNTKYIKKYLLSDVRALCTTVIQKYNFSTGRTNIFEVCVWLEFLWGLL